MVGHVEQVCDDFTFPAISDHSSICHFHFPQFSSSPIWFVPKTIPKPAELGPRLRRRKSFSAVEGDRVHLEAVAHQLRANSTLSDHAFGRRFLDAEEKMDMLWEDLNEELCNGMTQKTKAGLPEFPSIPELDQARVKALRIAKKGSLVGNGRSNLLVVLKVLKKFLLIHRPSCHKKVQ